jgi:acyl-CoA synthetase (NDP forming)
MSQRGLEALLRPKSIAVIGASMKPDRAGYLMMRNLLAGGFNGPVMPVTPAYKAVQGCWHGQMQSLPFVPDLAVLCTNAKRNLELLEALGKKGCKTCIILSSPPEQQPELLAYASRYQMRILGPNSRPARPLGVECQFLPGTDPQRQTGVYLAVGCSIEHHPRLGAAAKWVSPTSLPWATAWISTLMSFWISWLVTAKPARFSFILSI